MMKKLIFPILILLQITCFAQNNEEQGLVNWMSIEKADSLMKIQPKTILIDMYTDWCGWCKVMTKNTFSNPSIAGYINTFFYPVKFNAERSDSVKYNGKIYKNPNKGPRSTHELAVELMKGHLSYPTIVYIDEGRNASPVPGYMAPADIEPLLVYFAEGVNKYAPFDDFKKYFKMAFNKDSVIPDKIKWETFPAAVELSKKNPKKILLNIVSKWNNSSKVMGACTYNNPVLADYINANFYPVKIEAEMQDTIVLFGQKYFNENLAPNYPHQLVITMLQKQLNYPTLMIMNEQFQMIDKIPGYLMPRTLELILTYFGSEKHKTMKFDEYQKTFVPKSQ